MYIQGVLYSLPEKLLFLTCFDRTRNIGHPVYASSETSCHQIGKIIDYHHPHQLWMEGKIHIPSVDLADIRAGVIWVSPSVYFFSN